MPETIIVAVAVGVVILIALIIATLHGGAPFIFPVLQSFQYLDLTPISINVDLKNALSKQNIRIDVPSRFTVGISTEPGIMQNAAERLLGSSCSCHNGHRGNQHRS